jgi:hypothetical protein
VVTKETGNLRKVREAYVTATKQLGRPPRNMDELTPSLKQIGDPQELMRSRTGEPYEGAPRSVLAEWTNGESQ